MDARFSSRLAGEGWKGETTVLLEFELTEGEITEFKDSVESHLNGTLPVEVSFSQHGVNVSIPKQGRGKAALTAKAPRIARFVSDHIRFEHIPAVRTADAAHEIVNQMVQRELAVLDDAEALQNAIREVARLQEPILLRLSDSIKETLTQFLPDVREVKVQIPQDDRYQALRTYTRIIVDDGTPTLLEFKGDGVQSLAALGIMRHASSETGGDASAIIAIEEPESHLHPGAIHQLRQVLAELADRHQVVITTHNPLFVDRTVVQNNVIVQNNRAQPAKNIEELRKALGVRAADNLRHAEIVLVVEGEHDIDAVRSILSANSDRLRKALESGTISIDSLHGAGNLSYKLGELRSAICSAHCFLDDDEGGRRAFEGARREGLIGDGSVHWTTVDGSSEAELEDLYDTDLYADMLYRTYQVSLDVASFHSSEKWSKRMQRTFKAQGKRWDTRIEGDVKRQIGELVEHAPDRAVHSKRQGSIAGLVRALEDRLTAGGH